jgi:hypothetical protein
MRISGGGINSNKVTHYRDPKQEPKTYKVDPGRVDQLGQATHFAKGPLQTPGAYSNPVGPSDNMGQGPGANRVVMKSGSQGTHGATVGGQARPGATKSIFPGFK